jgi:DedD protein
MNAGRKINERGGIISKLIIIPAGITLMIGFFFLGYYVGKYEGKPGAALEKMPHLPDVVAKNLPKPEEYTFYKTLTEKDGKSVSIELKPKAQNTESKAEKKQPAEPRKESEKQAKETAAEKKEEKKAEKKDEKKTEKKAALPEPMKQPAAKTTSAPDKKTASAKPAANPKLRYTVQVSSHQEKHAAEDEVKRMKQSGFAAFIVTTDLPGKGTWYRVRMGSFSKKDAAEKLQQEILAKAGLSSIVVLE